MVLGQWQECNRDKLALVETDSSCKNKHWMMHKVWCTINIPSVGLNSFWKFACRRFCAFLGSFDSISSFYAGGEQYCVSLDIRMCYSTPPMPPGAIPCSNHSFTPSCTFNQLGTVRQSCFISQITCRFLKPWYNPITFECQKRNGPIDWGGGNKEKKKH